MKWTTLRILFMIVSYKDRVSSTTVASSVSHQQRPLQEILPAHNYNDLQQLLKEFINYYERQQHFISPCDQ